MQSIKKWLKRLLVLVFLLGVGKGYVEYNIARYSVYYASQMKRGEGTNPEMVMAIENLYWIDKATSSEYQYDFDGANVLTYGHDYVSFGYGDEDSFYELKKDNVVDSTKIFHMDFKGQFTNYFGEDPDKLVPIDLQLRQKLQKEVDELMSGIIKAQKKPSINLQWLFNKRYEKRFNE